MPQVGASRKPCSLPEVYVHWSTLAWNRVSKDYAVSVSGVVVRVMWAGVGWCRLGTRQAMAPDRWGPRPTGGAGWFTNAAVPISCWPIPACNRNGIGLLQLLCVAPQGELVFGDNETTADATAAMSASGAAVAGGSSSSSSNSSPFDSIFGHLGAKRQDMPRQEKPFR